ncbi:hypothetical protein EFD56_21395 [Rhizobium phaseoli]|nr:hypothetical protein EFD56_21395 [Rhizobium phaseoli]
MEKIPTFTLRNGDLEVLTAVLAAWYQKNHVDPESECARAATATALDLLEAGFRTREDLSIALADALHPNA